ncbi:MAG TPA: hypothetical protein VLM89_10550 [Phycisphaerae bacterium]|nr:hypothetical protein [Phycisphaerae bacterium]
MAGVDESHRGRIAILLALTGAGLVVIGLFLTIQHFQQTETLLRRPSTQPIGRRVADARVIQTVLFLLLMLVGVFTVASLAFLRWSRSFRRWLLHKPAKATPSSDVWAMHTLPEEHPSSPGDEPPSPEADEGAPPPFK